MRICTPSEMFNIERRTKIPEEILMESAGAVAAREILTRYWPELQRGTVMIFCGPGNNGADGLVIARHLRAAGVARLTVYATEPPEKTKPLFRAQWNRLNEVERIDLSQAPLTDLRSASLIVDALYGIGLDRPLSGSAMERLVDAMNASDAPIVAIDTPSGLNCTTGRTDGVAVRAETTLTFTLPKLGFFTAQGAEHCGVVRVLPIGFPVSAVAMEARSARLFTEKSAKRLLPARELSSNKSSFGHVAVFAGRPGFWGAGVLCTQAAFRIGSGYVTWVSETSPIEELKSHPEVMTAAIKEFDVRSPKFTAFVVGPGLGVGAPTSQLIHRLAEAARPVVLDADALTVVAREKIFGLPSHWLATPHSGELSRLLGISAEEIEKNRFDAVREAARKLGCLVLLKGYRTVIASDRKCVVIHSGNPALAKAGTGDVLAGFIGGLLAQGLSVWKAAALGAYVHGRLADEWVRHGKDVSSLVASDLSAGLPELLNGLRGKS